MVARLIASARQAEPGGELLLCDHAGAEIPPGIDLGIGADMLARHIAVDIGAGPLTEALAERLGAPAIIARVSRLVVDLNRPVDHPGLIPTESDGHAIPGNVGADRAARIAQFHAPYHALVAGQIARLRPGLIVAVHSFTPRLESGGDARKWLAGILYNRDARAARHAIGWLRGQGIEIGDNEPYSGRALNATLNRHGEANGIASFSLEVRNDQINDRAGVDRWAAMIADMVASVRNSLAQEGAIRT